MINQAGGKSLDEHIGELRKRIILVLAVLIAAMAAGFLAAGSIIRYLSAVQLPPGVELNAFSPYDSIQLYMRFALVIGLTVTIPFILYQLWCFVNPGLRIQERKAALTYIPLATALFILGLAFGYFVLFRMVLTFTLKLSAGLEVSMLYGVNQYFAFMLNILLPVGLVFELPIVILFLTSIRLLNPKRLRKLRRYAYMVLVVLSAVISPPDLLSPIIVMIPLILLFEASVLLSNQIYRKRKSRTANEAA